MAEPPFLPVSVPRRSPSFPHWDTATGQQQTCHREGLTLSWDLWSPEPKLVFRTHVAPPTARAACRHGSEAIRACPLRPNTGRGIVSRRRLPATLWPPCS